MITLIIVDCQNDFISGTMAVNGAKEAVNNIKNFINEKDVTTDTKVVPGDEITYTIIVKNTGNVTLTEVTINDEKLGIKDRKESVTLAPGAETTIQLENYTVTQADVDGQKTIYNTVTANGTEGTDPGTPVVEPTKGVTVTKTSNLVKAEGNKVAGKAEVNDTIDYAVIVKNIYQNHHK